MGDTPTFVIGHQTSKRRAVNQDDLAVDSTHVLFGVFREVRGGDKYTLPGAFAAVSKKMEKGQHDGLTVRDVHAPPVTSNPP